MNIFALAGLSCGISCFILALFTFVYGKLKIHRILVVFNIAVAIWGIGCFIVGQSKTEELALFGWKFAHIGGIFVAISFFHLVSVFCDLRRRNIILFSYGIGLFFLYLNIFTNILINKTRFIFNSLYYNKVTLPFCILATFWFLIVISGFFELVKFLPLSSGNRHMQTKYIITGFLIGFIGGTSTFLPEFKIDILYPFGNFGVTLYSFIVTYAILRHQLLDIEVVIKKSLVFAGMFAFVFGVVVAMAMLVAHFLGGANNLLSLAISALIITFTLRPVETWLINSTDKFLFQKRYEYKQILKAFIDEVITVLNLDEVISSTLELLGKTIHPYTSVVFILNKVEDRFQLYSSLGLEDKNITFTSESKLVSYLKKSDKPAIIKQIDGITGANPAVQEEMLKLKAVLVLPLKLHDDLIGFISLGKKKSDEGYTKDDLDVLLDLARTESIAVGNAQLLTEAAQAERRAAIGTMAAGINHEIGNPLNIINTKIQVFLTGIQRGFYQNKSKEEVIQECEAILNETLSQSNRIADITRRLSNFAKPSKEFRPQLVNISEEIDETLAVLGHDLELERIKIERHIPSDLPRISADKHELQQIFFNLIRNAGQAIEGTGTIKISAVSSSNGKVHIEIEDTGKGIAEDKMHRIFEPFFTTKGPTKGTGLGLSIVRQLVWRNKGEISFKSQVGVGTTFILEFPRGAEA
ncbi:MAG: ATP-binding protein [Candidatus Omnitrophota bacterium]